MHDATERLTSAALCAMTRFAEAPSAERALLVARHLDCVAAQGDAEPRLRDMCNTLAVRWRDSAQRKTGQLFAHSQ